MEKRWQSEMKERIEFMVKQSAPIVVNYLRNRKTKKWEVIEKHITLFNKVFKGKDISHSDWKADFNNKKIVELFRTDVGYSPKTASMDVFYEAYKSWKEFNKNQNTD